MPLLFDLQPGQEFEELICALAAKKRKTAKSGRVFIALRLRDASGERVARWFSPPDGSWENLENAQIVRAAGSVEDGDWRGEIKIYSAKAVAPEDAGDLNQFLPARPSDFEAHRDRFIELVRSIGDPHFKKLLATLFDPKGELWAKFCDAPAARNMHHAYRGGLLEHSAEVAALCDRAAWTLAGLDRDLLVTAALLHDIGKLEEMESGLAAGEYTLAGELVGHIVLGTCLVTENIAKIEGFPPSRKHELMHLILSHHGQPNLGAARWPMCGEALVLSQCDAMSAKVAQCRETAATANGASLAQIHGWDGVKQVYLGQK